MEPGEHADAAEATVGRPLDGVRILALEQMQALPYATQIIRYYLNEAPILPSTPTLWLGDASKWRLPRPRRSRLRVTTLTLPARSGATRADWAHWSRSSVGRH